MPNRILREGILTSPRIAKLGWPEEVFYRRMHSVVDDFGRYYGDPGMLRAACYPRQLNKVSDSDVGKWLRACVDAALVRVYQVGGEEYVQLLDFNQQVRAKKSKFPDVPSDRAAPATQTPSTGDASAHLGVSVSGVVSEGEGDARAGAPPPPKAKGRKTAMPADFGLSDRVKAWATEKGYGQLEQHLEAFKRKVAANGYTYIDWDASFMEAVREDWAKLRGRAPNGTAPPPDSTAPRGPDPALLKLAEDAKRAAKPPADIREQIASLTGKKPAQMSVSHETGDA